MEENKKYFNENLINLIKEYYGENGLRNQILHFRGYIQIEITTTDLLAVKIIVVKLIKLYNETLKHLYTMKLNKIALL